MTEQFANKISTTLAADYTAGSGTLTVASATGMPATGTFRLRLGNSAGSILICTARAGAVCTVSVEQNDGNAAAGDSVKLVNTAGAMNQLKADAVASGTTFGGDPTIYTWAWVNQGAAAVTEANSAIWLVGVNDAAQNDRMRTKAHTAPKRYRALLQYDILLNNGATVFSYAGLVMRESGTGKFIRLIGQSGTSNVFAHQTMTSPTVFGATTASETRNAFFSGSRVHLEFEDNNVNLITRYSFDNAKNFVQVASVVRTAHMAGGPNEVGFMIGAVGSPGVGRVTVLGWDEF